MSYLPQLRESLVAAAGREARRGPAHRLWRQLRTLGPPALSAVPGFVAVAATLAVLTVVLSQAGSGTRSGNRTAPATRTAPARPSLSSVLGLLRRPQRPADLRGRDLSRYLHESQPPFFDQGAAIRAGIRHVPAPWSDGVYLLPLRPPSVRQLLTATPGLTRAVALRRAQTASPGLAIVEQAAASVCCATAAEIARRGELSSSGGTLGPVSGSARRSPVQYAHIVLVVPDGVARVRFTVLSGFPPPQPSRRRHRLRFTAAVHDNVVAVALNQGCCTNLAVVWYDAAGRVLKRVGY